MRRWFSLFLLFFAFFRKKAVLKKCHEIHGKGDDTGLTPEEIAAIEDLATIYRVFYITPRRTCLKELKIIEQVLQDDKK